MSSERETRLIKELDMKYIDYGVVHPHYVGPEDIPEDVEKNDKEEYPPDEDEPDEDEESSPDELGDVEEQPDKLPD